MRINFEFHFVWLVALVPCWQRNFLGVNGFTARPANDLQSSFYWQKSLQSEAIGSPGTLRRSSRIHAIVPGSSLELIEPETGCEVVLLGCFHGSKSSALDVTTCMNASGDTTTQVVVLELCASRFADMRRDMQREADSPAAPRPWIFRFGSMISKTVKHRGLSTGLAAALLGGVSGMQTTLSGLEPGLEFRTAVEQVQKAQNGNQCDIVLADQNVDEILEKVGQLFSISIEMWKTCFQKGWDESFGREARALARAVGGNTDVCSSGSATDTPAVASLNLWNFCTRSPDAIRDMLRLLLPPAIMLQVIATSVDKGVEWMQAQQTEAFDALASSATEPTLEGTIAVLVVNWMILAFGYLSVALPASRVILRERDDTLTQGIREACRVAANNAAGTNSRGRVVAVLGLLHVNGIAERLQHPTARDTP